MRWLRFFLGSITFGAVLALLAYALMRETILAPKWRLLGSPPSPPTKILGTDTDSIWLHARNDNLYKCTLWPSITCTTESHLPDEYPGLQQCAEHDRVPRSSPGQELDRRHDCFGDVEAICSDTFVILEDGSIWRWRSCRGMADLVGAITLLVGGALAGLVGAVILSFGPRVRRWAREQDP